MKRLVLLIGLACLCTSIRADEGMWTFDNVPRAVVKQKYGVDLTPEWLDRVRGSVVRLETGCTGSFVSPDGLVLTNHHCAQSCLSENSTASRDLVSAGFTAASREQEPKCQNERVSVLVGMEDVTARIGAAVSGLPPAEANARRKQELTTLEAACEQAAARGGAPLKCESVTLYQGGQYWLYKYRRYDDVRLVFAPENAIAAFGGDPDNFQFPRWCLDMSMMRVYEHGKPAATPTHLDVNWAGAREGEPVFVAGHPGTTERLLTIAELETQRDAYLPFWLLRYAELRGRLLQFAKGSPEAARRAQDLIDGIENSIKVRRMEQVALLDEAAVARRVEDEAGLRAAIEKDPALEAAVGGAWDEVARAQQVMRDILVPYAFIEGSAGFNSELFGAARQLVRAAAERGKPNAARLREYTDTRLPSLNQELGADTPVYPDVEELRLSFGLERMREWLGPDDPLVRQVLGTDTPDALAHRLIAGTTLADAKARVALFDGGQAAVAASTDPMIALARQVDDRARALRARYEAEVEAPNRRAHEALSVARFKVYGTSRYPDATFTLRLSYGAVRGWSEKGQPVEPFTRLARLYERATGVAPFEVPASWVSAKPRLDMATAANFVTDNDIVGGNSGSPMVNARGEVVGLVFDGNIHSIAGSYWFDASTNRTVAVHPAFIRAALADVYRNAALAKELGIGAKP